MKINLFGLLLLSNTIFAQITGNVRDAFSQPIPYANVILYHTTDTSFISGTSTNEEGYFSISAENDNNYLLGVSSIGFSNSLSHSFFLHDSILLEDIVLKASTNELSEVTVTAQREMIQNTPFGTVVNIQNSLMTKGSSAMQVLERLPGILVDKRNNQFSLNGQNGITILFNGRRVPMGMTELMALLESTSADNIEKIELITSPSAKYDADGGAGVINVIFKKNENEGSLLNLSLSAGYGYKEKANTALNYSYGRNKFQLNAAYSYFHNNSKNGFAGFGTGHQPILGGPSETTFSTFFHTNTNIHNGSLSLLYQTKPKTEFGAEMSYMFNKANSVSLINNSRQIVDKDYIRTASVSNAKGSRNNLIGSFFWNQKINEKANLNIDLNFLQYGNDNPSVIKSEYFNKENVKFTPENSIFIDGNRGQSVSSIKLGVFKADYSLKINASIESEFGLKGSYSSNQNDSKIETNTDGEWVIDPRSQSTIFSNELLYAAYSQFKFKLSDKTNIHSGLRYEYWNRTLNTSESPFTISQFFPSFLIHHNVSDQSSLSLNYSRRISRPSYEDLIANLFYNDPTAVFSGNPLLKPTLSNALKFTANVKGLNLELSAQKEINPIIRYQITSTKAEDILLISPQNADFQNSLNLAINYPWQWASWAKLSISSNTSWRKFQISYTPSVAAKSYLFQSFNFSQTLEFPKEINVEVSGWRNFRSFTGHNKQAGFGVANLGLSKKLKGEKGTIQLSVTDLLKSFNIVNYMGAMTPIIFDVDTQSKYQNESSFNRVFRLSYSRSFGNMTKKNKRNSGIEEERRRVN
ncbi:outer membrane beta-barrel protein [uncultured Arcticibacterium sp.]|uniref:outer membrane beta-barrel protein n=1 Tax=uncultured Arcticibacterium sp. TaxID=2173042 RepID=UPI0030F886CB